MANPKTYEKFMEHLDSLDPNAVRSFLGRLSAEMEFMRGIADSISEGIMIVNHDLKITYRNRAATLLLGIPDDCSKLSIASFLKGIDWKELVSMKSCSARREIEVLYPEHRILRFYAAPHKDAASIMVILTDITSDFRKTESRVESERGKLVSMLAAGVAHEIGNPLNSLYLNLQLLQRMYERGAADPVEALDCVRESKAEVERLDTIINQFLKAVRPAKMRFIPVDLKDILTEALNFMRHEIEDRNVEVVCNWNGNIPMLQADPDQLKQALYNIFKNALQAMPGGGTLTVSCMEDDNSVNLSISDTGKGISPEDMNRIFQPFFTTKNTGNGLGLMIVERIVREHGAKLSIDSAEGGGTRFIIQFPLNRNRVRVLPAPGDTAGILPEPEQKDF